MKNNADFQALGTPNLYFAISAGNMDSMINHYTSDKKKRHNDAYTPDDGYGKRPDRAVIKYTNAIKRLYKETPVIIGGIEASLRRLAHYDYWSDKIRRSVLIDSKADLLIYGNAERALVEVSHRVAAGQPIKDLFDVRGVAFVPSHIPKDFAIIDSTNVDKPGVISKIPSPYEEISEVTCDSGDKAGQQADQAAAKKAELEAELAQEQATQNEIPILSTKSNVASWIEAKQLLICPVSMRWLITKYYMHIPTASFT